MGIRSTLRNMILGSSPPPPGPARPPGTETPTWTPPPSRREAETELSPEGVQAAIDQHLQRARVVLFMKGDAAAPRCGFSAAAVDMASRLGVPFHTVDVLTEPGMRDGVKAFTRWPTIPQVFVDGKFVGGSDIMREMVENGDLKQMLGQPPAAG